MLLLCGYKEFNVEYFIYINCRLISITATLCIVALNTIIASDWMTGPTSERTPRWWRWCHPSLPPSSLLSLSVQSGLSPRQDVTGMEEYSHRGFIFLDVWESADSFCCIMTCWITVLGIQWMYGQKNAHVLTPIFGDHFRREGAGTY